MMLEPNAIDWTQAEDFEVVLSAHAGIPQAIVEAKRRGLTY